MKYEFDKWLHQEETLIELFTDPVIATALVVTVALIGAWVFATWQENRERVSEK